MNIGQAASSAGLSAKTLRYYEDISLVTPGRGDNGYRDYAEKHVHQLRFLKRARGLGFSVNHCRTLLELYEDRQRASADVKAVASERIDEIDRKLGELTEMRRTLAKLVESCDGDDRPECPILDDFASQPTAGAGES